MKQSWQPKPKCTSSSLLYYVSVILNLNLPLSLRVFHSLSLGLLSLSPSLFLFLLFVTLFLSSPLSVSVSENVFYCQCDYIQAYMLGLSAAIDTLCPSGRQTGTR